MPVHVHRPDGDAPAPPVILFMDAPGIRPALYGHAERLAGAGYTAVLPDLYYALDPADRPNPERLAAGVRRGVRADAARSSAQLRDDAVLEDTRLMLDALPEAPRAGSAASGFCMGGRFGLRAAEAFGDRYRRCLAAAPLASLSPTIPTHRILALGCVTGDPLPRVWRERPCHPALDDPAAARAARAGTASRTASRSSPGADHGFTMPGRPAYDEAAAEQVWAGTLALLRDQLPAGAR